MTEPDARLSMREAWDRVSGAYLERRGNDAGVVSYGNLAPSEDELHLMGELRAKRVLDIGCGGGQNAVACARAGATVFGVDISKAQIAAATQLAQAYNVPVELRQNDASDLDTMVDILVSGVFDLVLAVQSLQYLEDPAKVISALPLLLRPGGTLIASIDHPLRNCFFDEELKEFSPFPVRSYVDATPLQWSFGEHGPMWSQHQPLGQWIEWVLAAGFRLDRVIEAPASLVLCDDLWPEDSPLAPLRNIPHTAILVAHVA